MKRVLIAAAVTVLIIGAVAGVSAQQPAPAPAEVPNDGADPATPPATPGKSPETPATEASPAGDPVTPASDREETGDQIYMLPDRVELLVLPDAPAGGEAESPGSIPGSAIVDSLFPPEIWPPGPEKPPGETPPDSASPAPVPALPETVPEDVAAVCFGSSPPPPLCDPQDLLPPGKAAPLRNLLTRSLNDRGSFQTAVILLRPHQHIPVSLDPPDLLQRWHGSRKGLLIVYFYGRPDRTQAFFTPETRRHHRAEDLRQVIDYGVREAARLADPVAQLQRFCYKTAARLDRLHRQGVVAPSDEPAAAAAPQTSGGRLWWLAAIGIQAAALIAGAFWWWRRRRIVTGGKGGKTVRLPDQEWAARLGAPHSGGSGAVIQFGVSGQRL